MGNGKITKELKNLGKKVNGTEPQGEVISEVIEDIVEDYETPNFEVEDITYSELVLLKSNNGLQAGKYYRITDYVTTTSQTGTQSAGHQFDIIVLALTNNKLSEDAYADKHEGDTYFVNNDLTKWKLKYCLENDTTRFDWADTTNGKGVIFRLIDENLNDLPYDFKNIKFARYKITAINDSNYSAFEGKYFGFSGALGTTIDSSDFKYYYTFNRVENGEIVDDYDLSIQNVNSASGDTSRFVKQVTIKEYLNDSPNYRGIKSLNNFVIASGNIVVDVSFGYGSHTNTIITTNDFTYNHFGSMMRNNLMWCGNVNHNYSYNCFQNNLILCLETNKLFSQNVFDEHFEENYCREIQASNIGGNSNKFAVLVKIIKIGKITGCNFSSLSDLSYCEGNSWNDIQCQNVTKIHNCKVSQIYHFTLNASQFVGNTGTVIQYVTINAPGETILSINFGLLSQSSSKAMQINFGGNNIPISGTAVKKVSKFTYNSVAYYMISWDEFDGTNFITKKYYSSDSGLTWTLAS